MPAKKQATLSAKQQKVAQTRCTEAGERLTPARLAAYAELVACKKPVSAYDLIERLEKRQGRKIAPLTVYRHLNFLIQVGLVHRLESTQSYLVCDHPEQVHQHDSQYLLCSSCGRAHELESKKLSSLLGRISNQHGFQPQAAIVEVKGLCGDCVARAKG